MTNRSVTAVLVADHRRLGALLARAHDGDLAAYESFRGGLLRHIGMEEKIILPALRANGVDPSLAAQLRLDHSALVAMLVPPPKAAILRQISDLLAIHDPLEEGDAGLYRLADEHVADLDEVVERLALAPVPPLARHFDDPRAYAAIDRLVARAAEARDAR